MPPFLHLRRDKVIAKNSTDGGTIFSVTHYRDVESKSKEQSGDALATKDAPRIERSEGRFLFIPYFRISPQIADSVS
ncbi:MAG: hypothetical protein ACTHOP_22460 [Mesorhizobium sp.]